MSDAQRSPKQPQQRRERPPVSLAAVDRDLAAACQDAVTWRRRLGVAEHTSMSTPKR